MPHVQDGLYDICSCDNCSTRSSYTNQIPSFNPRPKTIPNRKPNQNPISTISFDEIKPKSKCYWSKRQITQDVYTIHVYVHFIVIV